METKTLVIEPRSEKGKNSCRRLRKGGYIPGVLYSHGTTEEIKVPLKDFLRLFEGKITESVIFNIAERGNASSMRMAYVKDYQKHPVTGELLHVDFFRVTKDEKIRTHVPIEFMGVPRGVKMGGILEVEARELEVECLPMALPEKIRIDVSSLDTGESIHIRDVNLGPDVRICGNPETTIASVLVPRAAAEPKPVEAAVEEAPQPEEKKTSDGGKKEE